MLFKQKKIDKKRKNYYGLNFLKNTHLIVNARRKICNRIMFVYTFIDYSEQIECILRDDFPFFYYCNKVVPKKQKRADSSEFVVCLGISKTVVLLR